MNPNPADLSVLYSCVLLIFSVAIACPLRAETTYSDNSEIFTGTIPVKCQVKDVLNNQSLFKLTVNEGSRSQKAYTTPESIRIQSSDKLI